MTNLTKLILVIMIMVPFVSAQTNESNRTHITYWSDVDQDYGFYRTRAIDSNQSFSYINKTINISIGDTVIWINDATPDEPLTIVSDQDLWENNSALLRWNYQKYNYTFTQAGIYTFHVKEYPRLQHQKIIVNAMIQTSNITTMPTSTIPIIISNKTNETQKIKITPVETNLSRKTPGFTVFIVLLAIIYVIIIKKYRR